MLSAFANTQEPGMAQGADQMMVLHGRESALAEAVAKGEAQQKELTQQVQEAGNGPFGLSLRQQLNQVRLQLVGDKAQLDAVRAQLKAFDVQPVAPPATPQIIEVPPPMAFPDRPSFWEKLSPAAVNSVFVLLALGVIMPLSIGLLRRLTRRPAAPPPSVPPELITARLDRVDQALEAIAIEVERVSESHRFIAKTLAEKPTKVVSNDAQSLDAAPPLLALGAGPIEPIRVGERQTVKPSITPH